MKGRSIVLFFLLNSSISLFSFDVKDDIPLPQPELSSRLEDDARHYNSFIQSPEINACNTTIAVLATALNSNFSFIGRTNSYLNLLPNSYFASLFLLRPSFDVVQNPQQIRELLEQLQEAVSSIHDLHNALQFNLSVYLEKLSTFLKMRPTLHYQVKKTFEGFYKKIELWKEGQLKRYTSRTHTLFELEGAIATRLEAFKK